MTDLFMNAVSSWLDRNVLLALLACFGWGLASVLLSPCHVAAVSVMGTQTFADARTRYRVALFVLGHCLATMTVGGALIFFGLKLELFDHYWTVPFGLLFIYLAYTVARPHSCSLPHKNSRESLSGALTRYASRHAIGFVGMGFAYGLLSSGCVFGFLGPVLLPALPRGADFAFALTTAFAMGHCLPMLLAGSLAVRLHHSLHEAEHNTSRAARWFRMGFATLFALMGLALVVHPFAE